MPPRLCPTCRRISQGDALFCPRDGSRMEEGRRIVAGKFVLGRELGRGNMGTVYEAEQPAMNRKVAVKLLHGDLTRNLEMVERFEREAQAAGRVRHPNVVTVYDCGSDEGQGYLVMELLSGETLGHRLARQGRLQPEVALPLWLAGVSAVAEAHRRGVVHGDLKPDNLLLDVAAGGAEVLKVLDFGIARLQERRSGDRGTQSGMIMGTLLYMSPEQLQGLEVGPPTDVYALGLILCEMLTGRLPWAPGAEGAQLPGVHLLRLAQPPRPLGELCPALRAPAEVQALLDAALAPAPEDRPLDAGDLEARARAVLGRCPPPWLAAPPEDEWSSGEVTAVTPMHHVVAGAPERAAADEEPGATSAPPEAGMPPEAAEPATTQTALPAEGARRGRALGAVVGACGVIAALAGGLLRARAPSPRPAAASSLTPAPPAPPATSAAAVSGAAAPEASPAPVAAAPTAAAAPAQRPTRDAERPGADPAAPASAAAPRSAPPRPAAAPASRVALEVAVLSPAGRPVTISCKGGGRCVTVDGTCKVLVRAGVRCSCTATAVAYEPAQLSCPGAAAEGQRLEVRLEPTPF